MPHATDESTPLVNGNGASSKFISHLSSYPVVSDGVETFKTHPYGKKSLDLADSAYQRVVKPVEPHLETAYSYAKPYVGKADELGDSGLGYIDSKFPIVKEDTNTIVDKSKSVIFWPINVAYAGKDYVFSTWDDEYKKTASHKNRGDGFSTLILALISTVLKIISDVFQTVSDYIKPKYEEGKAKGSEYIKEAQDTAQHYKEKGEKKLGEYQKLGEQKTDEAKQEANKAKDEANKKMQK